MTGVYVDTNVEKFTADGRLDDAHYDALLCHRKNAGAFDFTFDIYQFCSASQTVGLKGCERLNVKGLLLLEGYGAAKHRAFPQMTPA